MNKTTMATLIFLLAILTLVSASDNNRDIPTTAKEKIIDMNNEIEKANNRIVRIQTRVRGLENALLRVENEQARTMLTRNLEKWQTKYKFDYEEAEATLVEGKAMIKTRKRHRLLELFSVEARNVYEIDNEGFIKSKRRNFWAILFKEKVTD